MLLLSVSPSLYGNMLQRAVAYSVLLLSLFIIYAYMYCDVVHSSVRVKGQFPLTGHDTTRQAVHDKLSAN